MPDIELSKKLKKAGKFVIISAKELPEPEVLPLYYLRKSAEQIFQISKSYAEILPLRVHSEAAFRGILFLNFLYVVLYINLREQLPSDVSVESAIKHMRNLMCKIFDDDSVFTSKPNKKQRLILEAISNTLGKF